MKIEVTQAQAVSLHRALSWLRIMADRDGCGDWDAHVHLKEDIRNLRALAKKTLKRAPRARQVERPPTPEPTREASPATNAESGAVAGALDPRVVSGAAS